MHKDYIILWRYSSLCRIFHHDFNGKNILGEREISTTVYSTIVLVVQYDIVCKSTQKQPSCEQLVRPKKAWVKKL